MLTVEHLIIVAKALTSQLFQLTPLIVRLLSGGPNRYVFGQDILSKNVANLTQQQWIQLSKSLVITPFRPRFEPITSPTVKTLVQACNNTHDNFIYIVLFLAILCHSVKNMVPKNQVVLTSNLLIKKTMSLTSAVIIS